MSSLHHLLIVPYKEIPLKLPSQDPPHVCLHASRHFGYRLWHCLCCFNFKVNKTKSSAPLFKVTHLHTSHHEEENILHAPSNRLCFSKTGQFHLIQFPLKAKGFGIQSFKMGHWQLCQLSNLFIVLTFTCPGTPGNLLTNSPS